MPSNKYLLILIVVFNLFISDLIAVENSIQSSSCSYNKKGKELMLQIYNYAAEELKTSELMSDLINKWNEFSSDDKKNNGK